MPPNKTEFDPSQYVFDASTAASIARQELETNIAGAGRALAFNLPGLRDYVVPVLPGDFAVITGQTSNFKTGLIRALENAQSADLMKQNRPKSAIFHVATEDTLESMMWSEVTRISDVDMREIVTGKVSNWAPIEMALVQLSGVPIIRIAYSASNIPLKPSLSLSNIEKCIQFACKTYGIEDVASIYLDYLQAMAQEEGASIAGVDDQMRLRVKNNVFGFRRMCGRFRAPGVLGVQATTDLKYAFSASIRCPGVYDGQESSSIGQHAQRFISTWMPKTTPQVIKNGFVEFDGHKYKVEDDLLFVWVPKQQGNLPGGKMFVFRINYKTHTLEPISWKPIEPAVAPKTTTAKPFNPRPAPPSGRFVPSTLPGLEDDRDD